MTAVTADAVRPFTAIERDFDDFYASAYRRLTLQLYAYLGDLPEAQDVVQEAFCRAYSKIENNQWVPGACCLGSPGGMESGHQPLPPPQDR